MYVNDRPWSLQLNIQYKSSEQNGIYDLLSRSPLHAGKLGRRGGIWGIILLGSNLISLQSKGSQCYKMDSILSRFFSEWMASLYKCTDLQPFFNKRNELTLKHILDMMQTITITKRQQTTRTDAVEHAQFRSCSNKKKCMLYKHRKKTQAKCKYRVVTQFSSDVLKNSYIFT